jgi:hypothetical protein
MGQTLLRWAPLVLAVAVTAGCAARVPHINDLQSNPGHYHDKTISVEGVVTSSWGVPLVPFKVYRIEDGTGELTVISRNERTPTKGAHVRVTGKVGDMAVFGGRSVGLHVQEERLSILRR